MLRDSFERFVQERLYLKNVSKQTARWYDGSWKAIGNRLPEELEVNALTPEMLRAAVVALRKAGTSAASVNTYRGAINAWLKWAGSPLKIGKQKTEQKTLQAYTPAQVERFLRWKPTKAWEQRIYAFTCVVLDTGLRASEALNLKRTDIDFDNLLLRLMGKGRKERLVPFSMNLRKILWRWLQRADGQWVFETKTGTRLSLRNAERDFSKMCKALGVTGVARKVHALRHTFALNYVRNGGDAFRLQRVLGHTTLEMTRKYVNLQTADLQAVHERLSVLAQRSA